MAILWGISVASRSMLAEAEPLISRLLKRLQCIVSVLDVGRMQQALSSSNDAWMAARKLS